MKKIYSILSVLVVLFTANAKAQDTTYATFVNVHQGNGSGLGTREVIDTFLLPHDLSGYSNINMHVTLNCPTGGCDIWDRFANILVYHDTDWFEIGRYVTPYGKSCGWTIDVTDYRNMLTDTVILKSFIDTWTNPGWLTNISFEFVAGIPVNPFVKVENLWVNYNEIYGDSTHPIDLQPMTRNVDGAATTVKVKIINTGHGQGNTNNAAEFSQKTHHLLVDGTQSFAQLLWRSNCATNPCSPQNGTWQTSRAGWCPGADVIASEYDITSYITPGQPVALSYELQNYFNTCSPNNPNCVASGNCPDCNYNNNGHTEPHYKIAAQMITYLSTPTGIKNVSSDKFSIKPNPSAGLFTIRARKTSSPLNVEIFSAVGQLVWKTQMSNYEQQFDLSFLPQGIYLIHVSNESFNATQKLIVD